MFGIRVFTPALFGGASLPEAGAELRVGGARLRFRLDLSRWSVAQYERQWQHGIKRLVGGASSSALVSRYAGHGDTPHMLWALWRVDRTVYVQSQCLIVAELELPFDPSAPYAHVGERVPVTECALPLPEWSVAAEEVIAAGFNIHWPFAQ